MGKYFGTDGFRGEAGITLTADHAYIPYLYCATRPYLSVVEVRP